MCMYLCTLLEHNSLSMVYTDDIVFEAAIYRLAQENDASSRLIYLKCLRTTAPPTDVCYIQFSVREAVIVASQIDVLGFRYRHKYCFFLYAIFDSYSCHRMFHPKIIFDFLLLF